LAEGSLTAELGGDLLKHRNTQLLRASSSFFVLGYMP